jgi:hypothetical protein
VFKRTGALLGGGGEGGGKGARALFSNRMNDRKFSTGGGERGEEEGERGIDMRKAGIRCSRCRAFSVVRDAFRTAAAFWNKIQLEARRASHRLSSPMLRGSWVRKMKKKIRHFVSRAAPGVEVPKVAAESKRGEEPVTTFSNILVCVYYVYLPKNLPAIWVQVMYGWGRYRRSCHSFAISRVYHNGQDAGAMLPTVIRKVVLPPM